MKSINEHVLYIFGQGKRNPFPLSNRMLKLYEEAGELSEAVNHFEGYLPHKIMKEPLIGEVADVIITALDVLRKASPGVPDEELLQMLSEQLDIKTKKWDGILPVDK